MGTVINIFSRMLLKYYSMSVWFAGKKSELYIKGTAFLFGNVLFFLIVAISVFFISILPFKLNIYVLFTLLFLLGHTIFYGYIKHCILQEIERKNIINTYKNIEERIKKRNAYLGLLLFILSFAIMNISFYLNFQGYLNR